MNDLVDFLRARLDEDEAIARAAVIPAHEGPNAYQPHPELAEWVYRKGGEVEYGGGQYEVPLWGGRMGTSSPMYVTCDGEGLSPAVDETVGPHIARHDPARVLREVAAKRALIDHAERVLFEITNRFHPGRRMAVHLLHTMGTVYADHHDYLSEWARPVMVAHSEPPTT